MKKINRILMFVLAVLLITFISIELVVLFKNYNLCKDSESTNALVIREKTRNEEGSSGVNTFLLYYVNDIYYNTLTNNDIEDNKNMTEICYNIKDPNKVNVIDRKNEYTLNIVNGLLFIMLVITIEKARKNNKAK